MENPSNRIIGCTSSGAALNADILTSIAPGVVLAEEAGELLESHLLTGTHRNVKHLILIGDHKQLRPKIENHELSVVSGNGHDLNRSLFERLVLGGCENKALMVITKKTVLEKLFRGKIIKPARVDKL